MRAALVALFASSSLAGCAARAPISTAAAVPAQPVSEQDVQQELQPDRPDVANGAHLVPVGLLQLEAGGQWTQITPGNGDAGVPFSFRLGLNDWLETRIEGIDGLYQSAAGLTDGFSGLSTGVKIAFTPGLAVIPAVQPPVGSQRGTGYSITLIGGTDFAGASHVDVNYGMGAIPAGPGHVLHQWLAVSVNRQVTRRFSPYVELYWFSRQDPEGPGLLSTDFGFSYSVNERFAFDCGADVGLTSGAPRAQVFTGVTVIVAEMFGHHGVHQRLTEAAERHAGRAQ